MYRYLLQRVALTVPSLLGVTLLVSFLIRLLPGAAVTMMLQDYASYAKDGDDLRAKLGLTQPFHVQYITWLSHVISHQPGVASAFPVARRPPE